MSIEEIDHLVKLVETNKLEEIKHFFKTLGQEESKLISSAPGSKGFSALHSAVFISHAAIVKLIVETGLDINLPLTATVRKGVDWYEKDSTPLHIACSKRHHGIVEYLLENGADCNLITADGHTTLHVAAEHGQLENVSLLLTHGVTVDLCDKQGENALHKACKMGHSPVIMLLLNHNSEINTVNQTGQTGLMLSVLHGHLKSTIVLLENRADTTVVDSVGNGLLSLAVINQHDDIIPLLLDHEVDVESKNNEGDTALILATRLNQTSAVSLLIEAGSVLNIQNNIQDTALLIAATNQNPTLISKLMKAGADKYMTNSRGQNAEQLVTQPEILNLFNMKMTAVIEEVSHAQAGKTENSHIQTPVPLLQPVSEEDEEPTAPHRTEIEPAPRIDGTSTQRESPPRPGSRLGQLDSPRPNNQTPISPNQSFNNTPNQSFNQFSPNNSFTSMNGGIAAVYDDSQLSSFNRPIGIDKATVDNLKQKLKSLESQILTLSLGDDRAVVLFRQFGKLHEEISVARSIVKDRVAQSNRPVTPRMDNGHGKILSVSPLPTPRSFKKSRSPRPFNPNFMVESTECLKSELQLIKSVIKPAHYNKLERYIEQVESFSLAIITFAHLLAINM